MIFSDLERVPKVEKQLGNFRRCSRLSNRSTVNILFNTVTGVPMPLSALEYVWDQCGDCIACYGKKTPVVYTIGGKKTVMFPSRAIPSKRKHVPVLFNKKQKLNGGWVRRKTVQTTMWNVASSNKMTTESKKAKKSGISVECWFWRAQWSLLHMKWKWNGERHRMYST